MLSELDLARLLELLHASNQSGELTLQRGDERFGSIYLHLGQLIHAQTGSFEGLDALNGLVAHLDAAFSFEAGVLSVEQSLAAYPTMHLVDRMGKQISGFKELLSTLPPPDARPTYQPTSVGVTIQATPQELGLLVLSNGQRTIAEIALQARVSVMFASEAMAKFRQANLVTLAENSQRDQPPSLSAAPAPPGPPAPASTAAVPVRPTRYWRGRPII